MSNATRIFVDLTEQTGRGVAGHPVETCVRMSDGNYRGHIVLDADEDIEQIEEILEADENVVAYRIDNGQTDGATHE